MLQPRESLSKRRGRFKLAFMRVFALTLLIWLVFYALSSTTDVHIQATQYKESWNISMLLKNAVYRLQSVIKLTPKKERKRKLILLWTNYFNKKNWLPSTEELQCPVSECDTTSQHSLLNKSSAVILHWRNIDINDLPQCIPSTNVKCPIWVLFNKEAPPHTSKFILSAIQNEIHWTVTYRKDSDIVAPYGKVTPKKMRSASKLDFNPKRRLLCWLVSNCGTPSNREIFVAELKLHVEVDIYGECGNMKCPYRLVRDCYRWLSNRCMFYLSLENSICRDYTTEKLYYALESDMVPVVMGNSSNYDHLPPRSYINANDFSSPKELADYLVTVGKDRRLYQSYFWWKKDYEVKDHSYKWFCDLCERLHNAETEQLKPHTDLVSWWFDQAKCMSWRNL